MNCGFSGPAWQLPKRVLPFASRSTRVTHASVMPGKSFCSSFQTSSFCGVTSSTQCPLPPPMSVLPFGSRMALKSELPNASGPWPPLRSLPNNGTS